ncbi:hypothetical protein COT97_03505 [Candidatus Falkowbacteria bacterium CG10_big_fil_rev_8_21_14_0_10_39_11]|uniref:Uncharacterized protein n=1 Tax=Candidatus Falkowbacteria bacterium CG10_big_fil_rev_8_21_14_0_10_39_11 TaxID=1974565 RepID=A0A2H0V4N1_9BACT|nr:MAG: hypothetical protein COT97_03505 [Candidatus Falkowbacteria bacterium CG10_big_fil_rev_8_21_14_0_10_39_11]
MAGSYGYGKNSRTSAPGDFGALCRATDMAIEISDLQRTQTLRELRAKEATYQKGMDAKREESLRSSPWIEQIDAEREQAKRIHEPLNKKQFDKLMREKLLAIRAKFKFFIISVKEKPGYAPKPRTIGEIVTLQARAEYQYSDRGPLTIDPNMVLFDLYLRVTVKYFGPTIFKKDETHEYDRYFSASEPSLHNVPKNKIFTDDSKIKFFGHYSEILAWLDSIIQDVDSLSFVHPYNYHIYFGNRRCYAEKDPHWISICKAGPPAASLTVTRPLHETHSDEEIHQIHMKAYEKAEKQRGIEKRKKKEKEEAEKQKNITHYNATFEEFDQGNYVMCRHIWRFLPKTV